MLDKKLKPWLLEVNESPSFNDDTDVDRDVKQGLIEDTFRLLDVKKMYGIQLKYGKTNDIIYYTEKDLIQNTVLEREAMSIENMNAGRRVAAYVKSRTEYLLTATVLNQKGKDILILEMDSGPSPLEVIVDNIRILPNSYPKISGDVNTNLKRPEYNKQSTGIKDSETDT